MDNLTLCVPRPSSALNPHKPVLVSSRLPAELPANHVVIEVDRFGFSANNVTYQALGEAPHFRWVLLLLTRDQYYALSDIVS
jgi:hypothetical protein